MGIDTVFHSTLKIYNDDGDFEKVKEAIETYSKNAPFSWTITNDEDYISFTFDSDWRIDSRAAGDHLLNVAQLVKDCGYSGSSVAPFETCWGDMEAGCLFYEITETMATVKIVTLNGHGEIKTFKIAKTLE